MLKALLFMLTCCCVMVSNLLPASAAKAADPVDECRDPQPGWIFCTSFEEGNLDIWDDWDGNPPETNLIVENPGPLALEGNHVVRLRVPPGTGIADLVKVFDQSYDRLYARWHIMWEEGYDFGAYNHGSGLHAGERSMLSNSGYRPTGDDRFASSLEPTVGSARISSYTYYRGMYMDCANPEGACWGDHFPCTYDEGQRYCIKPQHRETEAPPVMEAGRWYCFEMMLDGGTPTPTEEGANGILAYWIDGEEIGIWDDLWLRTAASLKLSILWMKLYHHAEHSVQGIMLDNIVISTERIGCAGDINTPAESMLWGKLRSTYITNVQN